MPVGRHAQLSLANGEFDELLHSREDVSFFYTSAFLIENVVPLSQGGGKRREGLCVINRQRNGRTLETVEAADLTATNGGTVANLIDGDLDTAFLTTTAIGTTAEYVVFEIDFGSATRLSAIEVDQLAFSGLPGGVTEGNVTLQYSSNAITWVDLQTIAVGTSAFNRRLSFDTQTNINRRYWRLIVDNVGGATDFSTAVVTVGEIRAVRHGTAYDAGTPEASKILRLTSTIDDEFILWLTHGVADIYRSDTREWVSSVAIPHTATQIDELQFATNLDTMILYHPDVPPHLIQRLGSDENWRSNEVIFDSVTEFPFSDATTGGQNEIQQFDFANMSGSSNWVIELNGEISSEQSWNTQSIVRDRIEAQLLELTDIDTVTVTSDGGDSGGFDFIIEFTGNSGLEPFPLLVINILDAGEVVVLRRQYGRPNFDTLWNATRGYPSCGAFYQGRHWMGGFKARPDVLVGSRSGEPFDFREDADPVASSPIVVSPNVDEQVTIQSIFPGRHLQVFTSSAETYVPDEPITPDNIAFSITSRYGHSDDTQPVELQGATIFVDRNGRAIREYLFVDAEQSYSAEPISLLAGHLVSGPQSMTLQRARDVDEPARLLIANTGTSRSGELVPAAQVTIDRAQQVTGFARMTTNGTFERFATTQSGDAFTTVRRTFSDVGKEWVYLEAFVDSALLDGSVIVENTDVTTGTGTGSQTVFSYSFSSPSSDADVAVWTRTSAFQPWQRVAASDYTVSLGGQTVTFNTAPASGLLIRINLRQNMVDLFPNNNVPEHFDGATLSAVADGGRYLGDFTDGGGNLDFGTGRWDFTIELGLSFLARVVLHPYKGRGDTSPTMTNQRIFRSLLQFNRTRSARVGIFGQTLSDVPMIDDGSDLSLEATLFSGEVRVEGFRGWEIEPKLEITQSKPEPWLLRSATYDVRF